MNKADTADSEVPSDKQIYLAGIFRAVRIFLAVTIFICAIEFSGLNHWCALGFKTFERYGGIGLAVVLSCVVLFVPRFRFGIPVAALLYLAWEFLVVAPYLNWVHDPKNPAFAELRKQLEPPDFIEPTIPNDPESRSISPQTQRSNP